MWNLLSSKRRNRRLFRTEPLEARFLPSAEYLHSLLPRPGVPADGFGWSHAASEDYHVIGNLYLEDQPQNEFVGEVQIHNASTGARLWTIANPDPDDLYRFGYSVDISGNWIVVGAVGWGEPPDGYAFREGYSDRSGRAYVYEISGGEVILRHRLDGTYETGWPPSEQYDQFGFTVSIDGNYAVVGAPGAPPVDTADFDRGHSYIFQVNTGALLHVLENPEPDAPGSGYDFGISVSADQGKVAVSNPLTGTYGSNDFGKCYVYDIVTGTVLQTLHAPNDSNPTSNILGERVIMEDGLIAVRGIQGQIDFSQPGDPVTYVYDAVTGNLIQSLSDTNLLTFDEGHVVLKDEFGSSFGRIYNATTGIWNTVIDWPAGLDPGNSGFEQTLTMFGDRLLASLQLFGGTSPNEVFVYSVNISSGPGDIYGTSGDDAYVVMYDGIAPSGSATVTVSTNGGPVQNLGTFSMSLDLSINGLGGNDSVRIVGTGEVDEFRIDSPAIRTNNSNLTLTSIETRTLAGTTGADVYFFDADTPQGTIYLEEVAGGSNSVDFSATSQGIGFNLSLTSHQTVNINLKIKLNSAQYFANLYGGSGNDDLRGNDSNNTIVGNAGNDLIVGYSSGDNLYGGTGDDLYIFGSASSSDDDVLHEAPGEGVDTLSFAVLATPVTIDLSLSTPQAVHANRTIELVSPEAFENIIGGSGLDTLLGNASANRIQGRSGNDLLSGGAGNDQLEGGSGDDVYHMGDASLPESDFLIEYANQGEDLISFSSVSANVTFYLGSNAIQNVHQNRKLQINSGSTFESAFGGTGADRLYGSSLNNSLFGNAGDDYLLGDSGEDYIVGDVGNDTLIGGAGSDYLIGHDGDDLYLFSAAGGFEADFIQEFAANGIDTISFASLSTGVVLTLSGTDSQPVHTNRTLTLVEDSTVENVHGGSGNDTLTGNALRNVISGSAGADLLFVGSAPAGEVDELRGGAGNDLYSFSTQSVATSVFLAEDSADPGVDTLNFANVPVPVYAYLNSTAIYGAFSNQIIQISSNTAFENLTGGSANDSLHGNSAANLLQGLDGHDQLRGYSGDDVLMGGSGNDFLVPGEGSDTAEGMMGDDDYVFGDAVSLENDLLVELDNEGNDRLFLTAVSQGITLSLGSDAVQPVHSNRTLKLNSGSTFEQVYGGIGNDTLTGNSLSNIILGQGGNDTIHVGTAPAGMADWLNGEFGDDRYVFHPQSNPASVVITENAGNGTDTLDFSFISTDVSVWINSNAIYSAFTNQTLQTIWPGSFENLIGGTGNDVFTGNNVANTIEGGAGDDSLYGFGGDDILQGSAGDDLLVGGLGSDSLIGGNQNDRYLFATTAEQETDTILEDAGTLSGIDTLSFVNVSDPVTINLNIKSPTVQSVHINRSLILQYNLETVIGGTGHDVIIGNAAGNSINGGAGRDILVGGGNSTDELVGGTGDDVLIPGISIDELIHPNWITRFTELRSTWTSAASYTDRVNSLRNGAGPGNSSLQAGWNLLNDSQTDTLTGGSGQDWYFSGLDDLLTDLIADELVDLL